MVSIVGVNIRKSIPNDSSMLSFIIVRPYRIERLYNRRFGYRQYIVRVVVLFENVVINNNRYQNCNRLKSICRCGACQSLILVVT